MNTAPYTPHESPYHLLSNEQIVRMAALATISRIDGYMTLEDVNSKKTMLHLASQENLKKINSCDLVKVVMDENGLKVSNTYDRVWCSALEDFLPIWELIHQKKEVAPLIVTYEWSLSIDRRYYSDVGPLESKQRAIAMQVVGTSAPSASLMQAAKEVEEKIEEIKERMPRLPRNRQQFGIERQARSH